MSLGGDDEYISVYVATPTPITLGHDNYILPPKSAPLSFTTTGAKRWWNRLSRLQKSVLLMSFSIILGFSCLLALSWNTNPGQGRVQHQEEVGNREAQKGDAGFLRISDLIGSQDEASGQRGVTRRREFDWQLPKDKGAELSTVPRVLNLDPEREGGRGSRTGGLSDTLRNLLSLDPAVPLTERKTPKTNGKGVSFSGPKNPRQTAVVEAFKHAWSGYRKYAWGKDHLRPLSRDGQDWFGLGLTIIDSLDTMWIMNLEKEFEEAQQWVESSLSFSVYERVNLFETTIRVVGGLLGAYHMSGEEVFLKKAEELASILLVAFKSPSGVPYSDVDLRHKTAHGPGWNPDSSISETTTLQLEFRDLTRELRRNEFEDSAMNVSRHVHTLRKLQGLVPMYINPASGKFRTTSGITLGARGDSYYEYLLKQWLQTGKTIDFLKEDYLEAMEGVKNLLVRRTHASNLTYVGELDSSNSRNFKPKMDHLVCFLPGTLALGFKNGLPSWHLDLAKSLLHTCYLTYKRQPTGLSPEIVFFNLEPDAEADFYVKPQDAHNLLRPETVESLWYLWVITGDPMYQDWGWEIFQAFLKHTRVENGFTSISSVLHVGSTRPKDMMESFFLGETLKYFYLLFGERDEMDLNKWVFNTEAHPFPIRGN